MPSTYRALDLERDDSEPVRIAFHDHHPPPLSSNRPSPKPKAPILLLHGFPQTSHQFRHVLPLLAEQGHHCIAPDYRGAGRSSKHYTDFRKTTMAADIVALLDKLALTEPVYVIGHDIGGIVAFALASRHLERVRSFHFVFYAVSDLPKALVARKERVYISHFLNKITYNVATFGEADVDYYAAEYAAFRAMRCAFRVYRAFEKDARENRRWVEAGGKCTVPSMVLSGEFSRHREDALEMAREVVNDRVVEEGVVEGATHYLAQENPGGFVQAVSRFLDRN